MAVSSVSSGIAFSFPPPAIPGVGTSGGLPSCSKTIRRPPNSWQPRTNVYRRGKQTTGIDGGHDDGAAERSPGGRDRRQGEILTQQVALGDVYQTLQTFMGGALMNYFNRFGRQWQVFLQAEGNDRTEARIWASFTSRTPADRWFR